VTKCILRSCARSLPGKFVQVRCAKRKNFTAKNKQCLRWDESSFSNNYNQRSVSSNEATKLGTSHGAGTQLDTR
jgi:hypothetical protein